MNAVFAADALRMARDFSNLDRHRLEAAVAAFFETLEQDG